MKTSPISEPWTKQADLSQWSPELSVSHSEASETAPPTGTKASLVGLAAEGPIEETLIVEGGEGLKAAKRADFELEGPGMSYLISSA